jgi:hypothetical protein
MVLHSFTIIPDTSFCIQLSKFTRNIIIWILKNLNDELVDLITLFHNLQNLLFYMFTSFNPSIFVNGCHLLSLFSFNQEIVSYIFNHLSISPIIDRVVSQNINEKILSTIFKFLCHISLFYDLEDTNFLFRHIFGDNSKEIRLNSLMCLLNSKIQLKKWLF